MAIRLNSISVAISGSVSAPRPVPFAVARASLPPGPWLPSGRWIPSGTWLPAPFTAAASGPVPLRPGPWLAVPLAALPLVISP